MPTYVCSVPNRRLDDAQKQAIATSITDSHSRVTGAPPFFVQVIVEEQGDAQRYIGGLASTDFVWIRVDMRAGRSSEQRAQLMLDIMNDVSRISGIAAENVWINLCMLEPTDMVEYARVLPGPGDEQDWVETLPAQVRERLRSLGIDRERFQL